jgi:hypothetical protein
MILKLAIAIFIEYPNSRPQSSEQGLPES